MSLLKCLICEFLGTAFLLATVVGSGILLHRIDFQVVAVTVLGVAFATGTVLLALINMFGSISAHFNPVVTLANAIQGNLRWSLVAPYVVTQVLGACAGVILANLMFQEQAVAFSDAARTGYGQWLGEFIATFGLLGVIIGCSRSKPDAVPQSVAAYVAGAILFTSSTCFANPAVTIARMFTTTITGIRPTDVPAFIGFEVVGALCAVALFSFLFREESTDVETPKPNLREFEAVVETERELALAGTQR